MPLRTCVPPATIRATLPELFLIDPEKVPLPPPLPMVKFNAPPAETLSTVPLPLRPPTERLKPLMSSSEFTARLPVAAPKAAAFCICKVPPLIVVPT